MSELSLPVAITAAPTPTSSSASDVLADPLSYGETFNAFLEQFVRVRIPTAASLQTQINTLAAAIAQPVGSSLFLTGVDLTANTGEYVYTHPSTGLTYLYANGATVSQTTYADLFAWFGGHIWAADPGSGNFVLPDTRSRSLWMAGTNAATDVGDNDGVTESSRQPKHEHTSSSLTVTGAPTAGSLATGNESAHTHGAGSYTNPHMGADTAKADPGAGAVIGVTGTIGTEAITGTSAAGSAHNHTVTGAPGLGTLDVGGTAGSGMSGSDAVAHIVIGSLVVRF